MSQKSSKTYILARDDNGDRTLWKADTPIKKNDGWWDMAEIGDLVSESKSFIDGLIGEGCFGVRAGRKKTIRVTTYTPKVEVL